MMSKKNICLKEAYKKGYRVINNKVYSPSKKVRKTYNDCNNYKRFNISTNNKSRNITVHRLVAYQKYGEEIFNAGIVVRHLDGNPQNCFEYNIGVGTLSDNSFDIPKEKRISQAIYAASHKRKFSDNIVKKIKKERKNGASYGILMKQFDAAKSTIRHVINNNYKTTKK